MSASITTVLQGYYVNHTTSTSTQIDTLNLKFGTTYSDVFNNLAAPTGNGDVIGGLVLSPTASVLAPYIRMGSTIVNAADGLALGSGGATTITYNGNNLDTRQFNLVYNAPATGATTFFYLEYNLSHIQSN